MVDPSLAHLHVPEDVRVRGAALGAAGDVHGLALRGHRGPRGDERGPGPHQHSHVDLTRGQELQGCASECFKLVFVLDLLNGYVCLVSTLITTEICLTCYQTSRHESESGYISGERGLIRIRTTLKWFSVQPS